MMTSFVGKVSKHFENITDPRVNRGENYPLLEMIFVALCATICDCNAWTDVAIYGKAKLTWLRKYMPFTRGVPSHDVFSDLFGRLDTIEFYAALESMAMEIATALRGQPNLRGETVAFDGKTLRGSHDKAAGKSALHSVSAWACGLKLCIGLKSVEDKSNEIPAVQALIDMLDLAGAVVTTDAMHTQVETAEKIIEKKADYIMIAKGNQPSLQAEVQQAMQEAMEADDPELRECERTEKNHGRVEKRSITVLPVPKDNEVFDKWAGIKTIGCIYRSQEKNGKLEESQEFFISSLPSQPRVIAKNVRSHWGIESSEHYVLDVTFSEDASRIRKGTGPEISSVFRRLALNVLQQDTTLKNTIRGKRKQCACNEQVLEQLIAGFCED